MQTGANDLACGLIVIRVQSEKLQMYKLRFNQISCVTSSWGRKRSPRIMSTDKNVGSDVGRQLSRHCGARRLLPRWVSQPPSLSLSPLVFPKVGPFVEPT